MKYRLGLDLGVGSIGSAVIELDNENNAKDIIDAGVRIFEISEGAEERRLKRTARKNLVRTKKRLELLAKKLFENGLWPNENPEGTDKLKSKSPYKIRTDALNEKLASPYYVGRAILHIAKHRGAGFVSASEETEEEILEEGEKSKAKKSSYDMMLHHLKETNSRTIGEFFYNKIISGKGNDKTVRQKKYAIEKNIVDYAIPRYLVKDEFNKIWDKQTEFYPQMKKENLKKEIYDILFYERPAAPYATGKCIYFREEDRLLKAYPLSEMRRIYEEVNNIRILNDMNKRKLTLEERDSIVNKLLLKGQNAGKQAINLLTKLPKGRGMLGIPETIKNEWHEDIAEHKAKQAKLVQDFELYMNTAEQILIAENEQGVADGKKEIKITEGRILLKAFRIIQDKGLWKGDKFRCYSNSSSMINIPKHGVAYEAQNNHCVDFYQKNGKIGWEVIKRFDVNQTDFEPQWKKESGKIIWSVQQGDILELDTPDEWKQYTDKERCLAKVKKFSDGKIAIDLITDARMTSPKNKELKYMFVNTISDKGLTYLINHKTRKVELTPFGKIKKKHKVLWNGTKTAA